MSFDAEAKEAELLAESARWDTSEPVDAEPGDIPVIDVGPWLESGDPEALVVVAAALREASETVGFHQLVGHGVAAGEIANALSWTRRFHALASEVKEAIVMDRPGWPIGGSGWLGYGNTKLPARPTSNRNSAFIVKTDHRIGFGDNQWPDERAIPGFRQATEALATRLEELALTLVPIYAVALDLDPEFFDDAFVDPFWRLRFTHYPPADPNQSPFGISPHVDTTFFTLLLSDGPGLVIYSHERERWIKVPHVEGAFVVNSGELLRQWSNDRFLSTRHFAVNPPDGDRYSVPFFFNANSDYRMECLPSCHGPANPPKYPPFSYNESQGVVQGE